MSKKRHRGHGDKREGVGFVALPHVVLRSSEFAKLSPFALKALMDLLAEFRGDNNGDLCAAWTVMSLRGWRSRDSLAKGLKALKAADFIVVTRQGGRHRATLYAVTFYQIDYCAGKLDIKAPTATFMGSWRKTTVPLPPVMKANVIPLSRPVVQSANDCTASRVNSAEAA